jgi:hypothetical protein
MVLANTESSSGPPGSVAAQRITISSIRAGLPMSICTQSISPLNLLSVGP